MILQGMILATGLSAGILATSLTMTGGPSLGAFIGLLVLVWRFLMPLHSVVRAGEQVISILESLGQINEVLTIRGEVYRGVAPTIAPPVRSPVVFDQVTLRFADSIVPPLLGVSLRLDAGAIVSLSGSSMSGKTMLVEMIAGLHAPTGGRILVNGADVRQIPVDDLRAAIAFSMQEPSLLYGPIAQNLDFAVPGASEDAMWQALLEAGVDDFVRTLPDRLATRLSRDLLLDLPYEVQKGLALAQTFLQPGPIFIFDDPTDGLGSVQRLLVRAAIRARRLRGTVLLISNDPDDIVLADRHVLIEQGRVVLNERGDRARAKLVKLLQPREAA